MSLAHSAHQVRLGHQQSQSRNLDVRYSHSCIHSCSHRILSTPITSSQQRRDGSAHYEPYGSQLRNRQRKTFVVNEPTNKPFTGYSVYDHLPAQAPSAPRGGPKVTRPTNANDISTTATQSLYTTTVQLSTVSISPPKNHNATTGFRLSTRSTRNLRVQINTRRTVMLTQIRDVA